MSIQMPDGKNLVKEIVKSLPLYCYVDNPTKQLLAKKGMFISKKTRLKIFEVEYMGEAGGVTCIVERPDGDGILAVSATQVNFMDEGEIYEKINEYKEARLKWLRQEEYIDKMLGRRGRVNIVEKKSDGSMKFNVDDDKEIIMSPQQFDSFAKISMNSPCPCGSGKKYKRCCGARKL